MSDAWHALEIEWQAACKAGVNDGLLRLWLDGSRVSKQSGLEDDSLRVAEALLEAVGCSGYAVGKGKEKSIRDNDLNWEGRSKGQRDYVKLDSYTGLCFAPT